MINIVSVGAFKTSGAGCTPESLDAIFGRAATLMLRSVSTPSLCDTGTSAVAPPSLRCACNFPSNVAGNPQSLYVPSAATTASRTRGSFFTLRPAGSPGGSGSYQTNDTRAPSAGTSVSGSRTRPTSAPGPSVRRAAGQNRPVRYSAPGTAICVRVIEFSSKSIGADTSVMPSVSSKG